MKIRSKLFVLLVSLILITLLAATFVSINVFSTAMIREIRAHLEDNSANFMNRISVDTSNRVSDIRFLGESMNIFLNQSGTDLVKKSELLKKFIATHKDYSSVSIYNKTGVKIADNKGIGVSKNVSNESFFKNAIQGYIYRDDTRSNYLKPSKDKEIVLSGPLYDKAGKINEILVFRYPLNNNIIERPGIDSQSKLGVNLLSGDGNVIYSSYDNTALANAGAATRFADLPIYHQIKDSNNIVESALSKDIGSPSGNTLFVAAKESGTIRSPDSIKNKWVLVTAMNTQEAFKEVLSLRNMFIIITAIVLAISIIVIYIVVDRAISSPLTKLKNAAIEIGKGNLDLVITSPSTVDEIGELSSQFGKMRARIRARTEELMRKDKELETANRALLENEKSKDEFISMVSHELKTPIVPIKLYSDMLAKSGFMGNLNQKQHKAVQTIRKCVSKLELLVNDILDVYKLDMGKLKFSKLDIDIAGLVDETILELKPLTNEKQIKLEADFRTKGTVYCDPKRIGQVFSNLIKNSIDFVPEKDGKIIVRSEEYKDSNNNISNGSSPQSSPSVLFTIEDNGIGISEGLVDKLFQKFYQIDTDSTVKHGGTGLGLVICKGIVEAHRGKIWVDITYTKGASVKFTLPRKSED